MPFELALNRFFAILTIYTAHRTALFTVKRAFCHKLFSIRGEI